MTSLPSLAITGATGEVGGRVANLLAARGVWQRLVVTDAARAPRLRGAAVVEASDYGEAKEMESALQGVETLFLVSGRESRNRVEQHITAIDSAVAAGVERIIYLSFMGAAPDSVFTLGRQHYATEQHIRDSGVRFTFLRSGLYADSVPYFTGDDGVIRGPAGDGAVSWISRDDIAETVVTVLLEPGHDGKAYDNTGPEALTLGDTAAVLRDVTGVSITYYEETVDEAWESRRRSGAADWLIEGWVSSYLSIAAGEVAGVSETVPRLTGHPAQALEPFLRANPHLWAHLVETPG